MLTRFVRAGRDVLSRGGNQQCSTPTVRQVDNEEDMEKSGKPEIQAARLSPGPRDSQQFPNRARPANEDRTASLPPDVRAKATWDTSECHTAPTREKTRFHDLDLPKEVMHGIHDLGFEYCTPIQAASLPKALAGVDVTGKAQTGTGKTAAFLITILTYLNRNPLSHKRRPGTPRALIMVPTRELALQVSEEASLLAKYCQCRVAAIYGGMDYQKQRRMITEKVVDIVVATPGRLLDYRRHGDVHLDEVEILVIDEADEMLNMGFMPDIRQIVHSTPPRSQRQTMLFGATLTHGVIRLASQWTRDPFSVEIDPAQIAVDTIDQVLYLVTTSERFTILYNMITQQNLTRIIVFCNRRDQTRRLADQLTSHGINCAVLSGDIAQKQRIRTLDDFRSGNIRVMVATDVAGRGIHVEGVSHVFNYTLPLDPEDYVHRIGRTGRAGATGISVGFATESDSYQIPAIEDFLAGPLRCVYPDDALLTPVPPAAVRASAQPSALPLRPRRRRGNGRGNVYQARN